MRAPRTRGYRLTRPGATIAPSTVREILKDAGISPCPAGARLSWSRFLAAQTHWIVAVDFFHVDTALLRRLHVLFFTSTAPGVCIWPASPFIRRANGLPSRSRNLLMDLGESTEAVKFLIRDGGAKFTAAFDALFTSIGIRIINTPTRSPKTKAIAERWICTVRRKCTDLLLIPGERHLRHVLIEYTDHYKRHRPHRTLDQKPPDRRSVLEAGGNLHAATLVDLSTSTKADPGFEEKASVSESGFWSPTGLGNRESEYARGVSCRVKRDCEANSLRVGTTLSSFRR